MNQVITQYMSNKNTFKTSFSRLGGMGLPIPRTLVKRDGNYIPFTGNGLSVPTPNTYPQTLADIASNSPTHGAALQKKGKMTYGQGIDFTLLPEDLVTFLMNVNRYDEGINDIINKISHDLPTFNGFCLKVHWNYDRTINSIEHIPFKNVRLGIPNAEGDITYYVVNNDWSEVLDRSLRYKYTINAFDPEMINTELPVINGEVQADQQTLENASQLIYYKNYSVVGDGFYPIPDYISGLDSAFTEESTGIAMRNQIQNGINGAYVISTGDTILDDESKQSIIDSIAEFTTGPQNAGGIMFIPSNVKLEKMEALPADTYTEVNKEIRQRIITAHNIPGILIESHTGGGFNNRAEELRAAFEQFQESTITGYQQQIIRVLNSVFDYITSNDYDVQIIPFINFNTNVEGTKSAEDANRMEVQDTTALN